MKGFEPVRREFRSENLFHYPGSSSSILEDQKVVFLSDVRVTNVKSMIGTLDDQLEERLLLVKMQSYRIAQQNTGRDQLKNDCDKDRVCLHCQKPGRA